MNENAALPAEVSLEQLSRGEWRSLVWGFWWRGLSFALVTALAGGLVGAVIGIGFGVMGTIAKVPLGRFLVPMQISCVLVGLAIALWSYRFYITWLVRGRYGSLRIAIVRESAEPN